MKPTTKLLLIAIALGLLSSMGCKDDLYTYENNGVEQYVINGKISTSIWWDKKIAWSKERPITTSKDTLRKDSIEAEKILKTIKSLK